MPSRGASARAASPSAVLSSCSAAESVERGSELVGRWMVTVRLNTESIARRNERPWLKRRHGAIIGDVGLASMTEAPCAYRCLAPRQHADDLVIGTRRDRLAGKATHARTQAVAPRPVKRLSSRESVRHLELSGDIRVPRRHG